MTTPNDIGSNREALLENLRARRLVVGDRSVFGTPLPKIEAGHEPQALFDATRDQRAIVISSYVVSWPGPGLCAAWAARVIEAAGYGFYFGSARDIYERDCRWEDTADLKVGMVVAVPRVLVPGTGGSLGHLGLYVGDGIVRDSADKGLRSVPLELWLLAYGLQEPVRWGWLGGLSLSY